MTNKEVLQHLLKKLEKLHSSIEANIDIDDPNAELKISAVHLQSYLGIAEMLTECEKIIKEEIEAEEKKNPGEPDKPVNQNENVNEQNELDESVDTKEYLEKVQKLDIFKEVGFIGGDPEKKKKAAKRVIFTDTARKIENLLDAINLDKSNISAVEAGLSVSLNDVFENGIRRALYKERDLGDINYKDKNALLGKEPDLFTDNLSPLPIDPAKVSEFKPELNIENKRAFDESFRQFLWLAMTDSKVSLFIDSKPELNSDNVDEQRRLDGEKQRILDDWKQRPAKKALDDAIAWIASHANPQVKEEYIKRLNEIAANTVSENKGKEFIDLDKDTIKVASVKNMISSLSKTSAFSKLKVSDDLNKIYKDANHIIVNREMVDDYNDKYQDLAYSDPEYSTYIGAAERCKLKDLYTKLVNLEVEGSSAYYKDMVQSVRKVLTTPYSSFAHGNEQLTKDLGMCELTCHKYLDTHKALPITQEGRDRVALAKSLRDFSQDFCQKSWEKISNQVALKENTLSAGIDKNAYRDIRSSWMDEKEFDSLLISSKLCSAVQPMRFRPSMHKKVPTFSLVAKFHAIISKISSIIPTVLTPSSWFTSHSAKKALKLTEKEVKDKVIAKLPAAASPQNVDKEAVGKDGLILDKRRIPLIWAKEIPEDPDQDIELTINVKQAVEGEDYAFGSSIGGSKDPNTRGKKQWDAGHGFFTLKYTNTDPVTGQKRRYQTTFGFGGGEYNDDAAMINWYLTDSMIKGSIHNDENERASIGQSFKITPNQFNKLITFTEGYAKGGYNLMKRNCCTFLADACKDIGLKEAENLFVEGDANLPAGLKFALAGATLATPILSIPIAQPVTQLVTTSRAAKFVGTPSYDYQTFGESLVTPEDIKQLKSYKGIATFHGYNPGSIAERIRSNYGQNFHSNRWLPKSNETTRNWATGEIKIQSPALIAAIKRRMTPIISKMKRSERDAETRRLNDICKAIEQNYNKLGKVIDAGIEYLKSQTKDPERIRSVALQLSRATKLYRENILSIYHNGLKSDDKLNVEFAHLISTIEFCDYQTRTYFEKSMKEAARSITMIHPNVSKFVDTKREAVASLACIAGKSSCGCVGKTVDNKFKGSDGTPFDLLSIYDVCENMEEYINASDDKRNLVDEFKSVNALKADINTPFTEREIRMMFNQIPHDEDEYADESELGFPHMKGSDALKGLLFEKYFSGFGPEIRKEADKFMALDAVMTIPENDNDPTVLLGKQRLKSLYANMIEKGIDFIDRKLANDPKARHDFEIMVDATMDYHGYQKVVTDDITEERVAANKLAAAQRVKLDIVKNLFLPQFLYQASLTLNDYRIIKNIHALRGDEGNLKSGFALSDISSEYYTEFENMQKIANTKASMGMKLTKENIYPDYIAPNYDQRIAELKTKVKENREKEAEAKKSKDENAQVENDIQPRNDGKGKENNEPQL